MPPVQFFRFLQLAVNGTYGLWSVPEMDDWQRFFLFCKRQALIGVGFTAVERLHGQGVECPKELRMRWMALAMQIEKRNRRMNTACEEVAAMFDRDGFDCCVLKGQGNLLNYPEVLALRRQSGDIDVWVTKHNARNDIKEVISYVRERSTPKEGARFCHIDMPIMRDIEIEVHYRAGRINSPLRNWRMQRWFSLHADECMRNRTRMGFSAPTASVNAVYQMTHIFTHFFDEGVGLRQLMDYYFVLKAWYEDDGEQNAAAMSKEEVMRTLRSFGMARFAASVMWVLQRVFAMPDEWLICTPDERLGILLLDEIMQAGNFGHYDERLSHSTSQMRHAWEKLLRIMRFLTYYPEEVMCEPIFRVYHWAWRILKRHT